MIHPKHIVAVSGLISHPNGKILLIRGPRRGWEFPGGQVEEGQVPKSKDLGNLLRVLTGFLSVYR